MSTPERFAEQMQRLEEQLAAIEQQLPADALPAVRALVGSVLEVHQAGLRALLDGLRAHAETAPLLSALCERPQVASLLLMHDLHPDDFGERVARALAAAHAVAESNTQLETLSVEGTRVVLRVSGAPAAAVSLLRRSVERLVCEHAPEAELEIRGGEPVAVSGASDFVPLSRLQSRAGAARP